MLHVRDVADAIQVIIELKCIEGGCEVVLGGSGLGEEFGIGPGVAKRSIEPLVALSEDPCPTRTFRELSRRKATTDLVVRQ